jgi:hypothetical protein
MNANHAKAILWTNEDPERLFTVLFPALVRYASSGSSWEKPQLRLALLILAACNDRDGKPASAYARSLMFCANLMSGTRKRLTRDLLLLSNTTNVTARRGGYSMEWVSSQERENTKAQDTAS